MPQAYDNTHFGNVIQRFQKALGNGVFIPVGIGFSIKTGYQRYWDGVVYFQETDGDNPIIGNEMRVMLDKLAEKAIANPDAKIYIDAYTNTNGSDAYNEDLSNRRANAAEAYLRSKNVGNTIVKRGHGESNTVKKEDGSEDKIKSRRAEIVLVPSNVTL